MQKYTSYEVMRRRKGGRIDRCGRLETASRFKAMYRSLGMDLPACAKFLQVSERTLHNWECGRHVIPFSAYKLLRLLNHMDLPGPSWAGWSFAGGKLVSPEGRAFEGKDAAWWSLLVRRAAMFSELYRRLPHGVAVGAEKPGAALSGLACDGPAAAVPAVHTPSSNTGVNGGTGRSIGTKVSHGVTNPIQWVIS